MESKCKKMDKEEHEPQAVAVRSVLSKVPPGSMELMR